MATDINGRFVPDDAPIALTYNADGTIATMTLTQGSQSWVNTLTWSNGNMTNASGWVKQ